MPRRRALIIGGSLGGLFAAHLLRAAGWASASATTSPAAAPGSAPMTRCAI